MGALSLAGETSRLDESALRAFTGPLTAASALAGPLATVLGPAATRRREPLDVGVPREP